MLAGACEYAGVEREEDEEQRGDDVERRDIGRLPETVEGAFKVVENAAEVDVLLGDARREDVAEARERLIGWREKRSRRLGGVVPDAGDDGGVEEVVDDGEAGDECGAEHQ